MMGREFKEATTELGAPEGMEDKVHSLPVWHVPGHGAFISQWGMTWRERLHCLLFGYVWLHVMGSNHPPLAVETQNPFHVEDPKPQEKPLLRWAILITMITITLTMGMVFLYFSGIIK